MYISVCARVRARACRVRACVFVIVCQRQTDTAACARARALRSASGPKCMSAQEYAGVGAYTRARGARDVGLRADKRAGGRGRASTYLCVRHLLRVCARTCVYVCTGSICAFSTSIKEQLMRAPHARTHARTSCAAVKYWTNSQHTLTQARGVWGMGGGGGEKRERERGRALQDSERGGEGGRGGGREREREREYRDCSQ